MAGANAVVAAAADAYMSAGITAEAQQIFDTSIPTSEGDAGTPLSPDDMNRLITTILDAATAAHASPTAKALVKDLMACRQLPLYLSIYILDDEPGWDDFPPSGRGVEPGIKRLNAKAADRLQQLAAALHKVAEVHGWGTPEGKAPLCDA